MSSACQNVISPMVTEWLKIKPQPRKILDIGVGCGRNAFLLREYLENWSNRAFPEQWLIEINGIDIWLPYLEQFPWNKDLYNNLYHGDAYDIIDKVGTYDLVVMGDVVEHLPKDKGIELIKKAIRISPRVMVSIPIGDVWLNNVVVADNQYEKHLASYEVDELINLGKETISREPKRIPWQGSRGMGGIFVYER